jgi:gamma-glutamylcyclotransferase (GGCT)/AIG2-like uncharacterized protein YtfP
MTDPVEFVFVYGTLRRCIGGSMASFVQEHCVPVGNARFNGLLYDLGDYPGAVATRDPSANVVGELYSILPGRRDVLLRELDRYEGWDPKNAASEFVRRKLPVTRDNGEVVEAWLYLFNRPIEHLQRIASGNYAEFLSSRPSPQAPAAEEPGCSPGEPQSL